MTALTNLHERLERVVVALECELLEASDTEVSAVVTDLGLKPEMRGSAALLGVTRLLFTHIRGRADVTEVGAADHDAPTPRRGQRLP